MSNLNGYIKTSQLTKNYRDPSSEVNFQALRGVDLNIKRGSFSAIIGPSGAGKSTLLNILGGMVKPSTGTLYVDGMPIHSLEDKFLDYYRRKIIGFLWQLPERNLLPGLSAKDNLMFAMNAGNYSRSERIKSIDELLTSVGLRDRMHHKLGQLSGGEAQRASLAVALANDPKILLADEPTGELDSETTLEVINYLKDINHDKGTTMIVVSHDSRFEKMTDQAYYILDGTISGLRRSVEGQESTDWTNVVREEISAVNQFGMVTIPSHLREKYKIGEYVKFIENEATGELTLRPVDHQ